MPTGLAIFPVTLYQLNMQKLGQYLLADLACTDTDLKICLDIQKGLLQKGHHILIGQLLLSKGLITPTQLAFALRTQCLDSLTTSQLFARLSRTKLAQIFDQSKLEVIPDRTVIYPQNSPAQNVYFLLRGTVSISFMSETGQEADLEVLEPGTVFGELAVLTDSSHPFSARSLERSIVLIIPKKIFQDTLNHSPGISKAVILKWQKMMIKGWIQSQAYHDHFYKQLLSQKSSRPCLPLVGRSKLARKTRDKALRLARSSHSLLIIAPPGSMKTRIAQYLAEHSPVKDGPFLIFDPDKSLNLGRPGLDFAPCAAIPQRELAQMAALFGYDHLSTTQGPPWKGFIKLAHNGILVIHNISRLEPKVQKTLASYLENNLFYPLGADRPSFAKTRIFITAADDLDLDKSLYETLSNFTLEVEELQNRKRDLKEIVNKLLKGLALEEEKEIKAISEQAMNKILAYDWPGNFEELESVVYRGICLARSEVLGVDDVFLGEVPTSSSPGFNLLTLPKVKSFFTSSLFPRAGQILIGILLFLAIALGLWGTPSPDANISLLLIWANWEPLLILSCFFLARIWCSVCPLGHLSDLAQKIPCLRLDFPPKLIPWGVILSSLGLGAIFWFQVTLDMYNNPRYTSILLLVMLFLAISTGLFIRGKIWCKILCPLGQMVGTFARVAMIELRSNPNYCRSGCNTYECNTGTEDIPGCPMTKGPFSLDNNHDCTLCGNCVKTCPHQSVQLNLRPPFWEQYTAKRADLALIVFIPLLWGSQLFRGLAQNKDFLSPLTIFFDHWSFELLLFSLTILFAFCNSVLGSFLFASKGIRFNFVYCQVLLPLLYANEISLRLVPLLNTAPNFFQVLSRQLGIALPSIRFILDLKSILILQVIIILLGSYASLFTLKRLSFIHQPHPKKSILAPLPLLIMTVLCLILL